MFPPQYSDSIEYEEKKKMVMILKNFDLEDYSDLISNFLGIVIIETR